MTIDKKSVDIFEVIFSSFFDIESTPWADVIYDYKFVDRDVFVMLDIVNQVKNTDYTLDETEVNEYKSLLQHVFDNVKM